jgi:hypothetical protein
LNQHRHRIVTSRCEMCDERICFDCAREHSMKNIMKKMIKVWIIYAVCKIQYKWDKIIVSRKTRIKVILMKNKEEKWSIRFCFWEWNYSLFENKTKYDWLNQESKQSAL